MADVTGAGPDGEPPSYEQARDELAAIVMALESGGQTLEQALNLWETGEALAEICQGWLDNARERLETVRATQTHSAQGAEAPNPPAAEDPSGDT